MSAAAAAAILAATAWFVDPANATALASDKNDGKTAATPLLTQAELSRRWMQAAIATSYLDGFFPVLQDIVVTYLSSPPAPLADPIKLSVARYGAANISFTYSPAVVKSSTLLAITASRGGTSWWRVTSTAGFVAGDVGKSLVDTTRNTFSTIVAVAGGVADITEPLALQSVANPAVTAPAMISPQAGDAYNIIDTCRVKLQSINLRQIATDSSNFLREAVSFLNFSFLQTTNPFGTGNPDAVGVRGEFTGIGLNASGVTFTQCWFDGDLSVTGAFCILTNTCTNGPSTVNNGRIAYTGGLENGLLCVGCVASLDAYVLIKGRVGDQQAPQASVILIGLVCLYGAQDCFTSEVRTMIRVVPVNYGASLIVGSCTRYVFRAVNGGLVLSNGTIVWSTTVVASFVKLIANESVPCNMLAYNQTTLALGALYEVTLANLDDPAKLAGCAVDPGTGSSVRPFSSH